MFFDDEFENFFKKMTRSFIDLDTIFEEVKKTGSVSGPFYYGYTMTIGPNGKPVIKEYGNIRPELLSTSQKREPLVDTIVDDKEKLVKFVAEMPGVEKSDIKVMVEDKTVRIDAERGSKQYHVVVPIKQKVDSNSAKATYKNGILELTFKQLDSDKPKGKRVEVE